MAIHDPTNVLVDVRDGIERLLRSRLCASSRSIRILGRTRRGPWMDAEHSAKVQSRRQLC